jgi:hypothetical protein
MNSANILQPWRLEQGYKRLTCRIASLGNIASSVVASAGRSVDTFSSVSWKFSRADPMRSL